MAKPTRNGSQQPEPKPAATQTTTTASPRFRKERCEDCRCFEPVKTNVEGEGECRAHSPVLMPGGMQRTARVHKSGWCVVDFKPWD